MYTYCLYCECGKSSYVGGALHAILGCQTIIPKQVQHTWSRGRMINRIHDLMPGYLFLYHKDPINISVCQQTQGVVHCLRTTDGQYELQDTDKGFALVMLERKGILGKTQVVEKDGRLELTPKSFRGAKVQILRVDHRNSRMQLEIHFLRQTIKTWVEYEIVKPEEDEAEEKPAEGLEPTGELAEENRLDETERSEGVQAEGLELPEGLQPEEERSDGAEKPEGEHAEAAP